MVPETTWEAWVVDRRSDKRRMDRFVMVDGLLSVRTVGRRWRSHLMVARVAREIF